MPLYRLRSHVLGGMRDSPAVQSVLRQLQKDAWSVSVPPDVAGGNVLVDADTSTLPVVLVVVIGAPPATIDKTVEQVAVLQRETAGFRPVFVTDTPALRLARRYHYPAEMLVGRCIWRQAEHNDVPWEDYARKRIGLMLAAYGTSASVTLGPAGLDDAARVVLRSLRAFSD